MDAEVDASNDEHNDDRAGVSDGSGAGAVAGAGGSSATPSDAVIDAIGTASEGFEYVERARGHLYSFHQLMGRADLLFGEAADELREAGEVERADEMERDLVGRNVLDGRWTFQIVEEFDDLYYDDVRAAIRRLEERLQGGRRHLFESRMKDRRRTRGRDGHERRPPAAHDPRVDTDDV